VNATTADEVLAFVPAGDEELFVVVTRPRSEPRGVAVVLLQGGGRRGQGGTPSPGRNRMSVELARSLAADGYHAVRLDYAGVGESSGDAAVFDVRAPFAEQIGAVTRWVAATEGVGRFAYMGGCFGGRAGLAAAAADPRTAVGVALWGSPLRDLEWGKRLESLPTTTYVRKAMTRRGLAGWADPTRRRMYRALIARRAHRVLRRSRGAGGGGAAARASTWFSPMVARQLRTLFQHRVPVLVMYGEADEF
jgi:pimeloyl-ACP methyl ester carboxylesterase